MSNPATIVETRDALAHLAERGFAPLLDVLSDPAVYTKGERVILAAIARRLDLTPRRAAAMLREARAALE